jgi:hypothetical protein
MCEGDMSREEGVWRGVIRPGETDKSWRGPAVLQTTMGVRWWGLLFWVRGGWQAAEGKGARLLRSKGA